MERQSNQSYLLNSMEQYEALISAIPGGIVVTAVDEDFTILFANQGYYEMVGYEPDEYDAKFQNIGNRVLHPDDMEQTALSATTQLDQTGTFQVKARLLHKTKDYIWVHFNGQLRQSPQGEEVVYIVVVDISEQLHTLRRLEKEQSLNEMIAALSDEAFFDCDLQSGAIRFSKNFSDRLGIPEAFSDYRVALRRLGLPLAGVIPCSLAGEFGQNVVEEEFSLTLPSGERVWYRCRFSAYRDENQTPVRAVGQLVDITRHKKQLDALSALAQRDLLTGLYNKVATENRIKECLQMRRASDQNGALLIIDVDNFKAVNDKLGHLYGDVVLTQLAESLSALFRSDDIVGRVGGDEYFVFVRNCQSPDKLVSKAKEICAKFRKTFCEGDAFVTISASIGIALVPEHDVEFDGLYQKADAALYDAKARGKNTFSIYHQGLAPVYVSTRTAIDSSAMRKSFKDNRIEYVFRLLYNSENPVFSIQAVLQLVTESYGFSRGYIFETTADGKFISNTFEWCAPGIQAEIKNLQNLPIESLSTATKAFEEAGMFIMKSVRNITQVERDILEPQGILSMFQFGIKDAGKLVGLIGFDDCSQERVPTDAEIDEIYTVCHVVTTFLLRQRSSEREAVHHRALQSVMEHMNSLAYVIQPESYTVLYENQNVLTTTGSPSVGQQCHLAYRGSPEPCQDCPLTFMSRDKTKHVMEIYNEKFDMHVRTEATYLNWTDGRMACLICNMDISEYKSEKN